MNQLYTRTYSKNDKGEILVGDDGRPLPSNTNPPGITGGFNFQAAWTTGWIAGKSMAGF